MLTALAMLVVAAPPAAAQAPAASGDGPIVAPAPADRETGQVFLAPDRVPVAGDVDPRNPFRAIPGDLKRFFSPDTARVFGILIPAAGVASEWDRAGIRESQQHLSPRAFTAGNVGGGFLVQTGLAAGTWTLGRLTGHDRTLSLGSDLVRAQILTQAVTQAGKFVSRRTRPDGSDRFAFPSGHTSGTFATATVLDRHFGRKVGIPAYAFATYVAMARMSANKHHVSDVIAGAAVGIAAGRTVTMRVGGARFDLGVAPTPGGAAVVFTRQ